MKRHIEQLIIQALRKLEQRRDLPAIPAFVEVFDSNDHEHGDYASNIALTLMKLSQKPSMEIAELVRSALPMSPYLRDVVIASPGFLNFYLEFGVMHDVIGLILDKQHSYGRCKIGRGKRILVEFLSSNPTGPLHIGHGRHAAYGIAVANLLDAVGFKTFREYYINDCGKPVDYLTASVWLRYLAFCGEQAPFPEQAFQGEYVNKIAEAIYLTHGMHFYCSVSAELMKLNEIRGSTQLDQIIQICKSCLGAKYQSLHDLSLENSLADIREEMVEFNINYDNWVSEKQLVASGIVDKVIEELKTRGHTEQKDNGLYLKTTAFGDDKDRLLLRDNGVRTCFADDIAYHYTKFDRGFDIVLDIFGKDQEAYLPRLRAAMCALGIDPERLVHVQLEWVTLSKGEQKIPLSNRLKQCLSLRELREEIGNDAARFFYLMRKHDQPIELHLDHELDDLQDSPIYYVQYVNTRIDGVFKQLAEKGWQYDADEGITAANLLVSEHENELIHLLSQYPDVVMNSALRYDPHLLIQYLRRLAGHFHAYYNASYFLVDEKLARNARLALISAVQQVLKNSCQLLGIQSFADKVEII